MSNLDEVAIRVSKVNKTFKLPHEKQNSIKSLFLGILKGKRTYEEQHVLKDVSFDIKKGEFFGIVGRNGSGKSTLLKLLAGIYATDSGAIEVKGKLTPFIELGVGFNPELTGRENVFLNGALLGFNRKEMEAMYDEIVEFAELERFMDQKLKNYSSGMQVRLAFSIAIRAQSDILVLDEVLAVGDEAFQKKCRDVFREYKKNKQTVVLVTHSMDSVKSLCTRAMMLSDGRIEVIGDVSKVANAYLRSNTEAVIEGERGKASRRGNQKLRLTGCKTVYDSGDTMDIRIEWPSVNGVSKVGVAIIGGNGEFVFGSNTDIRDTSIDSIEHSVELKLGPGMYTLTVATNDKNGDFIEMVDKAATFLINDDNNNSVTGLTRLNYKYLNHINAHNHEK